jgi:aryl-alcohol dehydrogenase-like predicted oxidoreductase
VKTRTLGRTGLEVSELGYGAWGISQREWIGAEDGESLRALHRAVELGVTFIDTALAYGNGHSEELVGRVVRESTETVVVATKVPPRNGEWPARPGVAVEDVFPGYWIAACADRSLRNLGLDSIDVLQLHVWDRGWVGKGDWEETVARLKADGKVRFFGVSINDHEPDAALPLVEAGLTDSLQMIFNVFDQSPADELLPAAAAANVGVIARVPFDEGGLTGKVTPETTFPDGDFRNEYFGGGRKQETWERANAIAADLGIGPGLERLPQVALRFCVSHPAVSTVIPGMRSVRNVEANAAAVELGPLSGAELETLARHRWDRNLYG